LAVLFVLFCIRGEPELIRKGASRKGESGVPEEVPPQASSKVKSRPLSNGQVTRRRPRQSEIGSLAIPKGEEYKGATQSSGRKVPRSEKDHEEDAVPA